MYVILNSVWRRGGGGGRGRGGEGFLMFLKMSLMKEHANDSIQVTTVCFMAYREGGRGSREFSDRSLHELQYPAR